MTRQSRAPAGRSQDARSWRWQPGGPDGELGAGRSGTWDSDQRCYVCVVRHGDQYHCWFTGNGFGRTGIGHATADID